MNRKIEWNFLKSPMFISWLYAIILAGFFYFIWLDQHFDYTLFPWMYGGEAAVNKALKEFWNSGAMGIESSLRYKALIGILVGYILVPTIFFITWRAIYTVKQNADLKPSTSWGTTLSFILSGMITLAVAVPSIPMAIQQHNAEINQSRNYIFQKDRDALFSDLIEIAINAKEYWILPTSSGGGDNSFKEYKIPDKFFSNKSGRYEISEQDGYTLKLKAISAVYPASIIGAEVDSSGNMRVKYEGFE